MVVLFGFLFGCFACFCVLVGCFVLELALLRSDLCSTFEPPKRDIVNAFANSFNQHNKVRRPGESHRGAGRKKKEWEQENQFLLFRVDSCPIGVDSQVIIVIDERPDFSPCCP